MTEGRAERLGKYIAASIRQYALLIKDPNYIGEVKRLLSEQGFEPRRRGGPNPKNNRSPLEDIPYDKFDIKKPEHHVALLIERGHLNYNAATANRVRRAILDNL